MLNILIVLGSWCAISTSYAANNIKGEPAVSRMPAQAGNELSDYTKVNGRGDSDWNGFKQSWVNFTVTKEKSDAIELEARCLTKEATAISGGCVVLETGSVPPVFLGSYAYRSYDANGASYSYWKCRFAKIASGQTIMAQAICK